MKCSNCGSENRRGIKFCETCGEPLAAKGGIKCPSCGKKNRAGVNFCEECGADLTAAAVSAPRSKKIAAGPAPVVVEVQTEKKKRRSSSLWLLLLLLLMVICCCCFLLLYEQVKTPDFVAPVLNPLLDQVRKVLPRLPFLPRPGGNNPADKNQDNGKGANDEQQLPSCDDLRSQLKAANLGQETTCSKSSNTCWTEINGLENYTDFTISYRWQGFPKAYVNCENNGAKLTCSFPYNSESDRVDYYISIGNCEENLGYSDGWLGGAEAAAPEPGLSEPKTACCSAVKPEQPIYFRDPPEVGKLYLGFGLGCEDSWNFDDNTCAEFDAYVGAKRDIFWASGECCPDAESPDKFLLCEAPLEDQKKSATKIELRYGSCYWETEFQSPYFAPPEPDSESSSDGCPAGESMCVGSCCTDGHCNTSGGSLGCW